ncbi:hypothetical protein [Marinospirillum sp.]|uniref:hypothetical protein n=1 Tax=Marinospirillum sp. TaxID=2183934 RepID=UPI003459DC90
MQRETIALHHAYQPDNQHAVAVPIHQRTQSLSLLCGGSRRYSAYLQQKPAVGGLTGH